MQNLNNCPSASIGRFRINIPLLPSNDNKKVTWKPCAEYVLNKAAPFHSLTFLVSQPSYIVMYSVCTTHRDNICISAIAKTRTSNSYWFDGNCTKAMVALDYKIVIYIHNQTGLHAMQTLCSSIWFETHGRVESVFCIVAKL